MHQTAILKPHSLFFVRSRLSVRLKTLESKVPRRTQAHVSAFRITEAKVNPKVMGNVSIWNHKSSEITNHFNSHLTVGWFFDFLLGWDWLVDMQKCHSHPAPKWAPWPFTKQRCLGSTGTSHHKNIALSCSAPHQWSWSSLTSLLGRLPKMEVPDSTVRLEKPIFN